MFGWLKTGISNVADRIAGAISGRSRNPESLFQANRGLANLTGIGARDVALEDYYIAKQSADDALERDMALQAFSNDNASKEAQVAREWQAQREDTYYQRKVEDMKTAGINPIMAISGGGADVGSTPTASSSSARSSGSNYSGSSAGNGLGAIASVLAGLITKGKTSGTTLSQTFNKHGELVRSTINSRR